MRPSLESNINLQPHETQLIQTRNRQKKVVHASNTFSHKNTCQIGDPL